MIHRTLSILFVIATIAILFSPLFFVSADNENLAPIHTHERVVHGWDANLGGPSFVAGSGCVTVGFGVFLYSVGLETCTHGQNPGCSSKYKYGKFAYCTKGGYCGGSSGSCGYRGCTCSSS